MSAVAVEHFTAQQIRVVLAILSGATATHAAKTAGVSRETVHRWLRYPAVIDPLDDGKRDLWVAAHGRLATVIERAIDSVEKAVEKGDLRASLAVLKRLGFLARQRVSDARDYDGHPLDPLALPWWRDAGTRVMDTVRS